MPDLITISSGAGDINTNGGNIKLGSGSITATQLTCETINSSYTALPTFGNTQIGYTKFTIPPTDGTAIGFDMYKNLQHFYYVTETTNLNTVETPFDILPIGVYIVTINFSQRGGDLKFELHTRFASDDIQTHMTLGSNYPEFVGNSAKYINIGGSAIIKIDKSNTTLFAIFSNITSFCSVYQIRLRICRIA